MTKGGDYMITVLISLAILLTIAFVVYLILRWLLSLVDVPTPISTIIWIVFAMIVAVRALAILGVPVPLK